MSRLYFSLIYTTVEDLTNVKDKRNMIKRAIQVGLDRISSFFNWPYLNDEGVITTVAPYDQDTDTSTVSVTNGSKTVTGSSTVFTAAMVGRKIRINGENAYYRIAAYVSATEITLEAPYGGETDSGLDFTIYKDEYRLAPDCDKYKILRQIEDAVPLIGVQSSAFDMKIPTPTAIGTPGFEIFAGRKLDTYTTGTVSASANTSVITGASTEWTTVEGLGKGSRIAIGSVVYTVKSVDTDTQITVYENIASAISASTAYEILLDNLIVQFYNIPDAAENVYYRYQRKAFPLVNDADLPDMPEDWYWLLVEAGLIWAWTLKDKDAANKSELRFRAGRDNMKKSVGYLSMQQRFPRKSIDENVELTGPFPPANYGIPISR